MHSSCDCCYYLEINPCACTCALSSKVVETYHTCGKWKPSAELALQLSTEKNKTQEARIVALEEEVSFLRATLQAVISEDTNNIRLYSGKCVDRIGEAGTLAIEALKKWEGMHGGE